jgi:hypothetical protein
MSGLTMGDALIEVSSVAAFAAADRITLQRPHPFRVYSWGFVVSSVAVTATAFVARLCRNVIATATRTNGIGGKTFSTASAAQALGRTLEVRPTLPLDFAMGEQCILEITTAPGAGSGFAWIAYRPQSVDQGNALLFNFSV